LPEEAVIIADFIFVFPLVLGFLFILRQ